MFQLASSALLCLFWGVVCVAFEPVIRYRQAEAGRYQSHPLKNHLLLFADEEAESSTGLRALLADAAARDGHRVQHVWVPSTEQVPVKYFGLDPGDLPALFMYRNGRDEKFRLEDSDVAALTADGIAAFTAQFFAGEVPLYVKSEPIPAPTDPEHLTVETIVARNLAARVHANDAVLVMFFKETCPHRYAHRESNRMLHALRSQASHYPAPSQFMVRIAHSSDFFPIYEQLAEQAHSHTLVVAKGNIDANEFRWTNFRLSRSPTVYLFHAPHKDTPVDFQAWAQAHNKERSLEGLLAFLEAHDIQLSLPNGAEVGHFQEL